MKVRNLFFCAALILTCWTGSFAQGSDGYATQDETDAAAQAERQRKYEEALKPHLEEAKKTYPDAKKRFLAGLPPTERFLLTVELRDAKGMSQQCYIEVKGIKDGMVKGIIASDIRIAIKSKRGDKYSLRESELIDWLIVKPDGTEEGNFVGKFLNDYQPRVRSY